jgi:nicotinamide-nucleotide amidase
LGELGIRVLYHSTVADDLEANLNVFRQACGRTDIVVASGGLGPTADDLTRDVLAQLTGADLVLDEQILEHIRGLFARFGREMPERNRVQAMFPRGSRIIPNPGGTAPGIALEVPRAGGTPCRLFALPGVPAEMFQMWNGWVVPELSRISGGPRVIRHHRIKCFGVSESEVETRVPDLIRRGRTPSVGITVSAATITLRITAAGATAEECLESMKPTIDEIRAGLGEVVFGEEEDELEHAVSRLLVQTGQTLATVEWSTGGLVAERLHSIPELSGRFLAGLMVPSRAAACRLLGLSDQAFDKFGPVSGEVAEQMARAFRDRTDADLVLAVSEFPELTPRGTEPQRFFIALADRNGVTVRSAPHFGHAEILKVRASKQALNMLRLALLRQVNAKAT